MALKTNRSDLRRQARRSELLMKLRRVYRAAGVLLSGLEPVGGGVYRVVPGDILHLRQSLEMAKELVSEEGAVECR